MTVYEVPPARLPRWLGRWRAEHPDVIATEVGEREVVFRAASGARLDCAPAFPPLAREVRGERPGFDPAPLLDHALRERTVGVALVRLGGCAVGVFTGPRLVRSKVDRRLVHGRHRAGGSSQRRFERRREGEARRALAAAAEVTARLLAPAAAAGELDAVVLGGDRRALATVLADRRLRAVGALAVERVLEVPEPRLDVLRATPERFTAALLRPREP